MPTPADRASHNSTQTPLGAAVVIDGKDFRVWASDVQRLEVVFGDDGLESIALTKVRPASAVLMLGPSTPRL